MKIKIKINNRILSLALAVVMFVASIVPATMAAAADETWGPQDRESFTWDHPASYVTFNSMTDNPTLGSERNFVRVKEAGTSGAHYDNVTVEAGKEYEVYIYYHNNASASLNESGAGIAQNVTLSTNFPTQLKAGDAGVVKGTISASNANPTSVWDTAYLNADSTVYLNYVQNSAVIHNDGTANGSVLDETSLFSDGGARLAYSNDYWGIIPGCNEFAGYITYRIKADVPAFWVEKTASVEGENNYNDTVTANVGDVIDFKVTYENTGTTAQNYVTFYDTLPDGLEFVDGSLYATTPISPNGTNINSERFSLKDGFVIGNYEAGEKATLTYKAKVVDSSDKFACGENTVYNEARFATENGTETDKVKVTVIRNCNTPTSTTDGSTPSSLPNTGPGEIAMAIAIVVVIGGGGFYLYKSQKMLRKVTTGAGGAAAAGNSGAASGIINNNLKADKDMVVDSIKNNTKQD